MCVYVLGTTGTAKCGGVSWDAGGRHWGVAARAWLGLLGLLQERLVMHVERTSYNQTVAVSGRGGEMAVRSRGLRPRSLCLEPRSRMYAY